MVDAVAIIPARGGSKRIPKKNIIDLHGKPMIAWTIEAALESHLFSQVVVSTDDEEIATVAKQYGAVVPFMRDGLSDDQASVSEVTIQVLNKLAAESGKEYNSVVQLMANCPLRNSKDINEAYEFFQTGGHDFQISCFKYGWMNPWWAHQLDGNNIAEPIFHSEKIFTQSQDLPTSYCPTGAIWIAKVPALIKSNNFYGKRYRFYPLSWTNAMDIDDYDDLEMASVIFENLNDKLEGKPKE